MLDGSVRTQLLNHNHSGFAERLVSSHRSQVCYFAEFRSFILVGGQIRLISDHWHKCNSVATPTKREGPREKNEVELVCPHQEAASGWNTEGAAYETCTTNRA